MMPPPLRTRVCAPAIRPSALQAPSVLSVIRNAQPRRARLCVRCSSVAIALPGASSGDAPSRTELQTFESKILSKMARFMGPAVLIPLGDPLMALGDTVFVGQFSGTTELAAMGPANTVMLFSLHIFQSLSLATLNLVAAQLRDKDNATAARYLGTGLLLALTIGCLGGAVLTMGSGWLIPATGVRDAALIAPSSEYLAIRGLALPAVLITAVAQSGKLAQRDSLTPCLSVALTVVVSLLANIVFVAVLGWGLKGAALTTVGTQYLGALALLAALHHPSSKLTPDWSIPSPELLWTYLKTMAPLTVVSLSKNLCYLIVQTTAATLTTLALAAHQATFSIWALFTWTLSPVEQACMAYLPTAKAFWQRQAIARVVIALGIGIAFGVAALLAGLLLGCPGILVKDHAVQPLIGLVAIQAACALTLVGLDVGGSSINIALKDYDYVARSYVVTLGVTAGYFALCRQQGWGLAGVWWGLAVFFGMRCMQSLIRALWSVKLPPFGQGITVSPTESQPQSTQPPTSATSQEKSAQGREREGSQSADTVAQTEAREDVAGLQMLQAAESLGLQPGLPAEDSQLAQIFTRRDHAAHTQGAHTPIASTQEAHSQMDHAGSAQGAAGHSDVDSSQHHKQREGGGRSSDSSSESSNGFVSDSVGSVLQEQPARSSRQGQT